MSINILIAKSILGAQAAWRERVALSYIDDNRNLMAAELLKRLSDEPLEGVPAEIVADLQGYSDSEFSVCAKQAAKLVGFRIFPGTLAGFIQAVIKRIDQNRSEWERAFRPGGER